MSSIAYLPWFRISADVAVGNFELVRYVRGERPLSGQAQDDLDRLLGVCRDPFELEPIPEATLIKLSGRALTDDLSDEEENEIAVFTELLAFTGLSAREFFNPLDSYVNRQSFEARRASFASLGSIYGVRVRRRDGQATHGIDEDEFRLFQPLGTYSNVRDAFDNPLLTALLSLQGSPSWGHLFEAIQSCNIANTDSDLISGQMEIVHMTGAFERLFDSYGESEIVRKMSALVSGFDKQSINLRDVTVRDVRIQADTLTEAWFRDLYRLRNNYSHGRFESGYTSVWRRHEHLLLAAYLFPLLFKVKLSEIGEYELSESDESDLYVFEPLAQADLFSRLPDSRGSSDNAWRRIRSSGGSEWSWKRATRPSGD